MINEYSTLQQQVFDRALVILEKDHGFTQVCTDQMMSDKDIERDGIEACAITLVIDTCYWEGTWP